MEEKQRTIQQNRAMHKCCDLFAKQLNEMGLDMKAVLKPEIDIPWTTITVKEFLWKPIMKAMLHKESTTECTTKDIDRVFNVLNRHLGERFGISMNFPSVEQLMEHDTP